MRAHLGASRLTHFLEGSIGEASLSGAGQVEKKEEHSK